MATEFPHNSDDPDRTRVHADLFDAIAEHHPTEQARRMAGHVLRATREDNRLVALRDGCGEAVYFDADARVLRAVPVDKHGTRDDEAERVWRRLGDPGSWVDAAGPGLDWVHPRFRWVLTLEDATVWTYRV